MVEFLKDYGLDWIGAKKLEEDSSDNNDMDSTYDSTYNKDSSKKRSKTNVDYKEFSFKIEKLNASLSTEPGQVKIDVETRRGKLVYGTENFHKIEIIFYKVF
jgi:hypothetical protein